MVGEIIPVATVPVWADVPSPPGQCLPSTTVPSIVALMTGREQAALACGVSVQSWDRHNKAGRVPKPIRLGGRLLWCVAELREWCAAGCPDRKSWEAMKSAQRSNYLRK